jgi:hypothetical protein
MRKKFEVQYELGTTPIEKIDIPLKSRDELPPVLRALQHIYTTPELNRKVFSLLEDKILSGVQKTGRNGMSLWEILVFSSVRLTLDCNYDRLEHVANYDSLVRSLLGISKFGDNLKQYSLQSLKDNVRLLDEQTLDQINQLVVEAGHQLKKNEKLDVKIDSYVLETNVHFPTDLNLLWDAGRKNIEIVIGFCKYFQLPGWRKFKVWRCRLKSSYHRAAKSCRGAGKNSAAGQKAVLVYLSLAEQLNSKLADTITRLQLLSDTDSFHVNKFNELLYFQQQLVKQIDLVRRRLIYRETIAHHEKVFSLFEPYTEWIKKGKTRVSVELGLRIAVATDQSGFILAHQVMEKLQDVDITVPFCQKLLSCWSLRSVSYDKGFWSPGNFDRLKDQVENLIMPKKGKLNKAEQNRQQSKTFKALRRKHAAVESAINCLEHHGLNRCPDKGIAGFYRYTAIGVLAYNLHKLGNILICQDRKILSKNNGLSKAA